MCPGAPLISGLRSIEPGVCEPSGNASTSVTTTIFGLPLPYSAQTLVGKPAAVFRPAKSWAT